MTKTTPHLGDCWETDPPPAPHHERTSGHRWPPVPFKLPGDCEPTSNHNIPITPCSTLSLCPAPKWRRLLRAGAARAGRGCPPGPRLRGAARASTSGCRRPLPAPRSLVTMEQKMAAWAGRRRCGGGAARAERGQPAPSPERRGKRRTHSRRGGGGGGRWAPGRGRALKMARGRERPRPEGGGGGLRPERRAAAVPLSPCSGAARRGAGGSIGGCREGAGGGDGGPSAGVPGWAALRHPGDSPGGASRRGPDPPLGAGAGFALPPGRAGGPGTLRVSGRAGGGIGATSFWEGWRDRVVIAAILGLVHSSVPAHGIAAFQGRIFRPCFPWVEARSLVMEDRREQLFLSRCVRLWISSWPVQTCGVCYSCAEFLPS